MYNFLSLKLELEWDSPQGHHSEVQHFHGINAEQLANQLPKALGESAFPPPLNEQISASLPAGLAVADYEPRQELSLPIAPVERALHKFGLAPMIGRYYPGTLFSSISALSSVADLNVKTPVRVIGIDAESLRLNTNHPLSGYNLKLNAELTELTELTETGRPVNQRPVSFADAFEQLLLGPGMQVRANGQPTDFFSGEPFMRNDEAVDSEFYQQPRLVNHLDAMALAQLDALHGRLLPPGARILDLMTSINSHLPADYQAGNVIGLGMNAQELAANPRLDQWLVHDLNANHALPFEAQSFDAVICSVSVEYLVKPLEVFREVQRVLKPGGLFVNSFSNRWFPTKAIVLWSQLHEFERMGLVAEYFLQAGGFSKVNTWSLQGLTRPADDPYAAQVPWSDPMYAVWSYKQENHPQVS